ncbi:MULTISPECIES: hypothetical protein [Halobacterium]|uniref:DUF7312 domain-containing protein n=4 Tax=Halobacterium salinarum TaxID=2242 RepID=Q9HSA6_HALSA|nr:MULTISPECIES: hypothetical protein [Halobacterium]AAG18901.1 hypothetical protein VNG_0323H [Halobacterium salinarum NRC-1]MBB6090743.1 hypothetical protein [Halobacterium salinarum]MCF2164176.1 hypothetical protein [Halobacterium salinarum]MCF2167748.1 hypothetical protein [Halobacterium salinarum]MCF2206810.1 hypothetical protein [Halobacterium salinarum]
MSQTDDDREWRFTLNEVGEDATTSPETIEAGSPAAENVAFFVLGVATMVGAIGLLLFG